MKNIGFRDWAGGSIGLICALVLAMAASSRASEVEILEALRECPTTEVACLQMDATLNWPFKPVADRTRHPAVDQAVVDENDHFLTHVFVRVRGRLDGGEPKFFRLKLTENRGAIKCQEFLVASLASREDGGGIVLTRQGVLEILSSEIQIGDRSHLKLIDPAKRTISPRLSSTWERHPWKASPVVHRDGQVYWRTPREMCLDLDNPRGFRDVASENCAGPEMTRASPDEIERVRDLRILEDTPANERLKYDLWRLEGAPFLIYVWGIVCT